MITELDQAIARVTTWIGKNSEIHHPKFLADLSMILLAAKDSAHAEATKTTNFTAELYDTEV